jgi:hypothetical protein
MVEHVMHPNGAWDAHMKHDTHPLMIRILMHEIELWSRSCKRGDGNEKEIQNEPRDRKRGHMNKYNLTNTQKSAMDYFFNEGNYVNKSCCNDEGSYAA